MWTFCQCGLEWFGAPLNPYQVVTHSCSGVNNDGMLQLTHCTQHWWTMSKQYPTRQSQSRQEDEKVAVDARLIAAIKQVVREEMGQISTRLDSIDKTLTSLMEIQQRIEVVEESIQFTSSRLDSLATEILPALSDHMANLAESLALQTLQIDVHRRKWNIVIHGIEGPAGEEETATRDKCVTFARQVLKVEDANAWHLAACHRLSRKENAGIIIRFLDLSQRDRWLSGSKHLKGYTRKISISQDLPPVLRPLKDSLMLTRSKLAPMSRRSPDFGIFQNGLSLN